MKKSIIIFIAVLFNTTVNSQKVQDCNAALGKDLNTVISSKEYSQLRDWLYEYYQKDEKERSSMKKKNSNSFSGNFKAIVKNIPINATIGEKKDYENDFQAYKSVEEFYLRNKYLTNEKINELFISQLSDYQLSAYTSCLNTIKNTIGLGFSYTIGGDPLDEFYIQVKYNSMSSGQKITFKDNATYTNLLPIGSIKFKDKESIIDRQTRTQYFKRINPEKDAIFSFDIYDKEASIEPIVLPAVKIEQPHYSIPIGTIVSSVLSYDAFLTVNNMDLMSANNMEKVIWVPCDGRDVLPSIYGSYSGGKVPDLRGVFLRGVNDFSVLFPSTKPVNALQKNPENKLAGEFQLDSVGNHSHGWTGMSGSGNPKESHDRVSGDPTRRPNAYPVEPVKEYMENPGTETRPKNISVYYYIKIN